MTRVVAQRSDRGFTLLENILALGVFAIAAFAVIESIGATMLLIDEASEQRLAQELVRSRIREISRSNDVPLHPREIPVPDRALIFQEKAEPLDLKTQKGESMEGLFDVTVSVVRKSNPNESLAESSTWLNVNLSRP